MTFTEHPTILIIDDEPHICEVIRLYAEHSRFRTIVAHTGKEGLAKVAEAPSLVLLDVMLPDMTGFDVCQSIRALPAPLEATPVIMLTAKGESVDKLRGFQLGADDYIVKPFDPNELMARVKAVLRRAGTAASVGMPTGGVLVYGNLTVEMTQYRVTVGGQRVELTPKEIELLHCLAVHPGRVFTRDDLLEKVWGFDFSGGTRTVDAHVKNLRKKLGEHPEWRIQTLWGIGYSFEVTEHGT